MKDLETFYEKHYEKNNISYVSVWLTLIFSITIIWIFSHYGIKDILTFIKNFVIEHKWETYTLAFFAALAEGTIILALVPGTIVILILGSMLFYGYLDFYLLFPIVVLGAFIGDNIGYFLGKKIGIKILKIGIIDILQYKIAEKFLKDHGGKAVFFSRFINGIKEIVPFIAGSVKMNKKKFQLYNFIGAIGWALLWLGFGYFFYANLDFVDKHIKKIFMLIGFIFFYFMYRYFQKNREVILKN